MKKRVYIIGVMISILLIAGGIAAAASYNGRAGADLIEEQEVITEQQKVPDEGICDENGAVREEFLEEYYAYVAERKEAADRIREVFSGKETSEAVAEDPYAGLTEMQKASLEEIRSRSFYGWFLWPREEAVILGEDIREEDRVSYSRIREMVENGMGGQAIFEAVLTVNRYPDMTSGPAMNSSDENYLFFMKDGGMVWMVRSESGYWLMDWCDQTDIAKIEIRERILSEVPDSY